MSRRSHMPRAIFGLLLVSAGAVLLLGRLGWIEVELGIFDLWPLVFVFLGLVRLVEREWGMAFLFFALGGLFLAPKIDPEIDLRGLLEHWPLILLAIGVYLVARSFFGGSEEGSKRSSGSGMAILRKVKIDGGSEIYTGEGLTAVLGNCELDLTEAQLPPEGATIEVFGIWGGVVVRVPEAWNVDVRALTVMGGIEQ
ncbi:MAG: cell wall-active antibiotics response protein, partial [Holophagales bacterium]|nr:cell wall-active antibiotics response protein [Holophagales bacterium]